MAATLYSFAEDHNKTVKLPQYIDASGTTYKFGSGATAVLTGTPNAGQYSVTDIQALAMAGLRWIATGRNIELESFDSTKETTKVTWTA